MNIQPQLYFYEAKENREATLVYDSGYTDPNGEPTGFYYRYELTESGPAADLKEVLNSLGSPSRSWRLS